MTQTTITHQKTNRYFFYFCLAQLLIWTLVPYWLEGCLPFDTAESIAWGQQWMLGYNKHPPLAPWLSAIAFDAGGFIGVYLLAQLTIVVTFYAIWRLAQRYFTPPLALLAVLLLEGNLSCTFVSPNFNPTALMLPLWALTFWCFYDALKTQRTRSWLALGVLTALNILTKYETATLFIVMLMLMLSTTEGRTSFKNKGLYAGLALTLILIAPHFYNSAQQGFPEIQYALHSTVDKSSAWGHLTRPLNILANQLGTVAGMIILIMPFMFSKSKPSLDLPTFERQYLYTMAFGPFLLTLLLGAITGSGIDNNWFVPYFSLFGVVLVYWTKPVLTRKTTVTFVTLFIVILVGTPSARYGGLILEPYFLHRVHSKTHFPAQAISDKMTQLWDTETHNAPFKYVAGDHYLTAFISTYVKSRPVPFMDWSLSESPWINVDDLKTHGALFVWYAQNTYPLLYSQFGYDHMPTWVKKAYPQAHYLGVYHFRPATFADVPDTVNIAVAILLPSAS
jgi:4-amino-4-deoxy-L-arabinose transferase-like glycosyltransferase